MPNKITLKILPVLHGDAICVRFLGSDEKNHSIFIDGGFASTYSSTLKKEAERIVQFNETIDLFIITHTDQDHISGVLKFIDDFGDTDIVGQYWFNYSKLDSTYSKASNKISIADGIRLREYLKQKQKLPRELITNEIQDFECFGANLDVLSPSRTTLENYELLWRIYEEEKELETLLSSSVDDYSDSIEQLASKPFREDKKLENGTSITFILRVLGKTFLFLADSHPSDISSALRKYGYSTINKLKVDYVKLSHHASRFNTNDELVSLIDCQKFIISANGKNRYFFPHKEALARVLSNSERDHENHITFFFNYNNEVLQRIFSEDEKLTYNFSCEFPGKNQNGITIQL